MADSEPEIPLSELIDAVRGELELAAWKAENRELQLRVQDVQLELEIQTSRNRSGEGGLKIWVVNIGSKRDRSEASTQKVTLTLGPIYRDGTSLKVSDRESPSVREE
jgi:hypothetical protein